MSTVAKKLLTLSGALAVCLIAMMLLVFTTSAETEGSFTYTVTGGEAMITGYSGADTSLTLPDTLGGYPVRYVADRAFSATNSITSLVIPDGIRMIGEMSFSGCAQLRTVSIGSGLSSMGDGNFAILGLTESFTVSTSNSTYCSQNGILYNKARTVLIACPAVKTTVTIPSTVTEIAANAFYNNTSLETVTFPTGLKKIGDGAFASCTALTEINIPDSVTTIGANAFKNCEVAETIHVSSGLKTVGENAFFGCTAITELEIPASLRTIPANTFEGLTGLEEVTIPYGVKSIGAYAFAFCYNLKTINIPLTVTSIGTYAFFYCSDDFNAVTIPSTVLTIGDKAFGYGIDLSSGISDGTEVKSDDLVISGVTGSAANTYATSNGFTFNPIGENDVYPDTIVKTPTDGAVSMYSDGIDKEISIVVSSSTGEQVTPGLYTVEWTSDKTSLSVTPDTSDPTVAYLNTTTAESGTVTVTVKKNAGGNETLCTATFNVTVNASAVLTFSSNATRAQLESCTLPAGAPTDVVIPDTYSGVPVTIIKANAFDGLGITSVQLPSGLTGINTCAFRNTSLSEITIPATVTTMLVTKGTAFGDCDNLYSINVESGNAKFTSIDGVLYKLTSGAATSLMCCPAGKTAVTIPAGVTSIGAYAFSGNANMMFVPATVTSLANYSMGYEWDGSEYVKISNYSISGVSGSAAETYATENGFTFVDVNASEELYPDTFTSNPANGTVDISDDGAETELSFAMSRADGKAITAGIYDIQWNSADAAVTVTKNSADATKATVKSTEATASGVAVTATVKYTDASTSQLVTEVVSFTVNVAALPVYPDTYTPSTTSALNLEVGGAATPVSFTMTSSTGKAITTGIYGINWTSNNSNVTVTKNTSDPTKATVSATAAATNATVTAEITYTNTITNAPVTKTVTFTVNATVTPVYPDTYTPSTTSALNLEVGGAATPVSFTMTSSTGKAITTGVYGINWTSNNSNVTVTKNTSDPTKATVSATAAATNATVTAAITYTNTITNAPVTKTVTFAVNATVTPVYPDTYTPSTTSALNLEVGGAATPVSFTMTSSTGKAITTDIYGINWTSNNSNVTVTKNTSDPTKATVSATAAATNATVTAEITYTNTITNAPVTKTVTFTVNATVTPVYPDTYTPSTTSALNLEVGGAATPVSFTMTSSTGKAITTGIYGINWTSNNSNVTVTKNTSDPTKATVSATAAATNATVTAAIAYTNTITNAPVTKTVTFTVNATVTPVYPDTYTPSTTSALNLEVGGAATPVSFTMTSSTGKAITTGIYGINWTSNNSNVTVTKNTSDPTKATVSATAAATNATVTAAITYTNTITNAPVTKTVTFTVNATVTPVYPDTYTPSTTSALNLEVGGAATPVSFTMTSSTGKAITTGIYGINWTSNNSNVTVTKNTSDPTKASITATAAATNATVTAAITYTNTITNAPVTKTVTFAVNATVTPVYPDTYTPSTTSALNLEVGGAATPVSFTMTSSTGKAITTGVYGINWTSNNSNVTVTKNTSDPTKATVSATAAATNATVTAAITYTNTITNAPVTKTVTFTVNATVTPVYPDTLTPTLSTLNIIADGNANALSFSVSSSTGKAVNTAYAIAWSSNNSALTLTPNSSDKTKATVSALTAVTNATVTAKVTYTNVETSSTVVKSVSFTVNAGVLPVYADTFTPVASTLNIYADGSERELAFTMSSSTGKAITTGVYSVSWSGGSLTVTKNAKDITKATVKATSAVSGGVVTATIKSLDGATTYGTATFTVNATVTPVYPDTYTPSTTSAVALEAGGAAKDVSFTMSSSTGKAITTGIYTVEWSSDNSRIAVTANSTDNTRATIKAAKIAQGVTITAKITYTNVMTSAAVTEYVTFTANSTSDKLFLTETSNGKVTIIAYNGTAASVRVPSFVDGCPVTAIAAGAFEGTAVTSVTIPKTVTTVGAGAFPAGVTVNSYSGSVVSGVTEIAKPTDLGMLNDDSEINSGDALVILKSSVGIINLTDDELTRADINMDGVVDSTDALLALKYSVGIITEL